MKIIIQELIKGNITTYEYKKESEEELGKQLSNLINNYIPFSVSYGDKL